MGSIQRFLFGTATVTDIRSIEKKLMALDENLDKTNNQLKNLGDQTVAVINRTAEAFVLIQEKFNKQDLENARVNVIIRSIVTDMNRREEVEAKSRLWQIYLATYIGILQTKTMLITEYNTQVQSFVRGFEQLQTGLLSSDIINPFNLKQTLNSVRTKLDRGYELATHDLSFYYITTIWRIFNTPRGTYTCTSKFHWCNLTIFTMFIMWGHFQCQ